MSTVFAAALRRLRKEKNITQARLAQILFVDRSSVASWETGRRVPDILMLKRIARVFNVDVRDLLDAAGAGDGVVRVILVDDEKIILEGELQTLRQAMPQAEVHGFMKPSEALSFAETNRVSLAFLDIRCGGENAGFALCNGLLMRNPHTNAVYVTAFEEYSVSAWSTGACGFLLKPLTVDMVKNQLTRLRYPLREEPAR